MTTPTELITRIRQVNNIVGDTFFSDAEILQMIFYAHSDLAIAAKLIERSHTTTTVSGTQEYAMPTRAFSVKRVEYDGEALTPVTFDEDDLITGYDADTTTTGTPKYWYEWNHSVFLRPIPDAAKTLKVFSFHRPQELTIVSTFEINDEHDAAVIDYCKIYVAEKENAFDKAQYYQNKWNLYLQTATARQRMRKRGNRFAQCKDESVNSQRVLEI